MFTFETSDGRILSYLIRGDGPLLVMIPGGPGMDPEAYFDPAVLPGWTQLILCPRGTGASEAPPTPEGYRVAGYITDVDELRRHLGVERLTLYGNSHGATVALAYAGTYPRHISRMVLANGLARMDEDFAADVAAARDRFVAQVPDGVQRLAAADSAGERLPHGGDEDGQRRDLRMLMSRYVASLDQNTGAYLDRLCAAPMHYEAVGPMYEEFITGLDLLAGARDITVPTLVIGGELDVTVPVEHAQKIADALPDAHCARLAGAGHFVEVEVPRRWSTLVQGFLTS